MKRVLALLLILTLCLMAIPALAAEELVVYSPDPNDRLNLRERPSQSAKSLGKYYSNSPVTVLSYVDDAWARVSVMGYEGYMMRQFLANADPNDVPMVCAVVMSVGAGDRLNLRERPSESARSLGKYGRGTIVLVYGFSDKWAHVSASGMDGFMRREFLACVDVKVKDYQETLYVYSPKSYLRLNLRAKPDKSAQSLGLYFIGTPVMVLGQKQNGFYPVRIGAMEGYMDSAYLRPVIENASNYGMSELFEQQVLYEKPSFQSTKLRTLPKGQHGVVLGFRHDGWAHVSMNGEIGFIRLYAVPGNWGEDAVRP